MRILLFKAHPRSESFCHALADAYITGATEAGNEVDAVSLCELDLQRFLRAEHKTKPELTTELILLQKRILDAEMLVFAYPTWWATPPAMLKLFLELVLLSGFAYRYRKWAGIIPTLDKLLIGKSARLIVTMDAPPLYYRLFIKDPGFRMMNANLRFCGIKPVYRSYFGSVKLASDRIRQNWLQKAYQLGLAEQRKT